MLAQALYFVLETLLGLLSLALLLRFYLQLTGAPFHNPISQAVVAVTNFIVRPTRRVVPSIAGLDLSTILLAYIAQFLLRLAGLWLDGYPIAVAVGTIYSALLGLALVSVLRMSVYIFLYAIIIQAVLSWINPHNPAASVLESLARPLLKPLRRLIKPVGGLDLSPLAVFVIAQLLLMLVIAPIERQLSVLL
jgi:YggT family protein